METFAINREFSVWKMTKRVLKALKRQNMTWWARLKNIRHVYFRGRAIANGSKIISLLKKLQLVLVGYISNVTRANCMKPQAQLQYRI